MAKFMLILHAKPGNYLHLSPEETQRVLEKYRAWTEKFRADNRLVACDELKHEGGKVVSSQQSKLSVVDGPYSEAREVVAGYYVIRAASYDETVALVADSPHLHFGRIEIREVVPRGVGED